MDLLDRVDDRLHRGGVCDIDRMGDEPPRQRLGPPCQILECSSLRAVIATVQPRRASSSATASPIPSWRR